MKRGVEQTPALAFGFGDNTANPIRAHSESMPGAAKDSAHSDHIAASVGVRRRAQ
jgi:hypothetical protein